jgi:hypothetical protein
MEWTIQDPGAAGELISAIAVVATLLYLAVQVRHGKESIDASSELPRSQSRPALVANVGSSIPDSPRWSRSY